MLSNLDWHTDYSLTFSVHSIVLSLINFCIICHSWFMKKWKDNSLSLFQRHTDTVSILPTESQTVNFLMKVFLRGKCLDITLPVLCTYIFVCADLSLDSESSVSAVPSGLMRTSRGLSDSWLSVCVYMHVCVCFGLSVSVPVSLF